MIAQKHKKRLVNTGAEPGIKYRGPKKNHHMVKKINDNICVLIRLKRMIFRFYLHGQLKKHKDIHIYLFLKLKKLKISFLFIEVVFCNLNKSHVSII